MNATVWGLVGLVVGVGVAVAVCRLLYAARSAAVVAERDLLRERVLDLETSLAEDMETAALLAPLKDALVRVETHVGSLERDRMEQFGSLRALLSRVEGETQHLGRQTASLAGSLRSSTVRGAWGEVQLRRVLEASGMLPRCDFDEQGCPLVVGEVLGLGVEEGVHRHLGVDDQHLAAGQPHHDVGPDAAVVGTDRGDLLVEVAAREHARRLEHAPQLHLAPRTANGRGAQRARQ